MITGSGAVCAARHAAVRHSRGHPRGSHGARARSSSGTPRAGRRTSRARSRTSIARALVDDRKLHKLIRRTDLVGLYAAGRAIDARRHRRAPRRPGRGRGRDLQRSHRRDRRLGRRQLREPVRLLSADDGGATATSSLSAASWPTPSIRCGSCARCPTTCSATSASSTASRAPTPASPITASAGLLAVIEANEALRNGEADRVVAVGHETPIEPQMVLYYHGVGLLASELAAAVRRRARRQPVRRRRGRARARDGSLRRQPRRARDRRGAGRRLCDRSRRPARDPRRRRRTGARDAPGAGRCRRDGPTTSA